MSDQKEGHRDQWVTGVEGLRRRHVKSVRVEWEDKPPGFVAEQRLADIFRAMRLGFVQMDEEPSASGEQLRTGLSESQE